MRSKYSINIILFLLLIGVALTSIFYGTVKVPIIEIVKVLLNKTGITNLELERRTFESIVFYVRLPRVLTALIIGGALAVCGCTIQSLLKNPIADSGIIGISSGASLGAVLSIALGLSAKTIFATPFLSACFALLISAVVYRLATLKGRTDNLLLILSGIAISSFIGAITTIVLTNLMESQMKEYIFWSVGSLSGRRWDHFLLGVFPISILLIILFQYGKELNVLLLSEEDGKALGLNIKKIRSKILITVALITASSVCVGGNIGFVGLVIPHILRKIIGSDNRKLLKTSFLAGATFLMLSDLVSRMILAPKEVSVGIITALIGAPYFIYLIIGVRKEGSKL
ncbi:MAG: iron ABC transporter permease [Cetobacterium sp.]|uniref:FecCD family ABC transporter permease n=1 Tax=Cetobacterium sp. TaxID=2071632 RepID=UPI002FC6C0D1